MFKKLFISISLAAYTVVAASSAHAVSSGPNQLPDIGTSGLGTLSLEKEREIGKNYMQQIRAGYPMLSDPVLNEYLKDLGYKLVVAGSTPIHPFSFFLINNNEINAFAFFGGYVGVHSGLLLRSRSESELASVLAHEIAHVNQRHLARQMEAQNNRAPLTTGALLGSILLAVLAPQAGIAAFQTTVAANQQLSLNYSRRFESEADRIGIRTLAAAGYDPYAAPAFFTKLNEQYRYTQRPPQFLLTHPLTENRIADVSLRAQQYPRNRVSEGLNFHLAKARVKVRFSGVEVGTIKRNLEKQRKSSLAERRDGAAYGLALVALEQENLTLAKQLNDELLARYPHNLFLIDAATDIDLAMQANQRAITRLQTLYQYMPNNTVVALNYANALKESQQPHEAIPVLRRYLQYEPESVLALKLLTDVYGEINDIAHQYVARAEHLALLGQYERATKHLRDAIKQLPSEDHFEVARLDAKILEWRKALGRKQALEKN